VAWPPPRADRGPAATAPTTTTVHRPHSRQTWRAATVRPYDPPLSRLPAKTHTHTDTARQVTVTVLPCDSAAYEALVGVRCCFLCCAGPRFAVGETLACGNHVGRALYEAAAGS
jgi:hypothetical protein